jgi:hypothetical protein
MYLLFHLGVVVAAVACVPLAMQLLSFRRHSFFYFILGQFVVYCFLAPTTNVYLQELPGTRLGGCYLYLQCVCLGVFLPAFVIAYLVVSKQCQRQTSKFCLTINERRLSSFSLISLVSAVACICALTYYGLLFRSVGHSALASQYLDLPVPAFLFIRSYDRLLLSLVIVNYLIFRYAKPGAQKTQCLLGLMATLGVQVFLAALNSRLQLVTTFVLLGCIDLMCKDFGPWQGRPRISWRAVVAAVVVLLGMNFTINLRQHWQGSLTDTIQPSLLATNSLASAPDEMLRAAAARLDGIDLMAQMRPELQHSGLSLGSSWCPAIVATVGYLWDSRAAQDVKAELATSPKYYLMYDYAGINQPDYPSCMLTDAYGNFGLLGILAAAIVLGIGCAIATQYVVAAPTRLWLVVGITSLQIVSYFEGSLLYHIFLGWIRHFPSMVILYLICPLQIVARVRVTRQPRRAYKPEPPQVAIRQQSHLTA